MSEPQERSGFDSESLEPQESTKPLKIDKGKSRFVKQHIERERFEEKVKEIHDKSENKQQLAFDLGRKFLEILNDKTLKENKGPIRADIERENIGDLIKFAVGVNTDENEQEGMGSVSLITLLYKAILIMRDKNNELEYKLTSIENDLKLSRVASDKDSESSDEL